MVSTREQAKRSLERGSIRNVQLHETDGLVTLRRLATYRERSTLFVESQAITPELVTSADRVYVCGRPPSTGALLAEIGDAGEVYAEGHYPIVKVGGSVLTWAGTWFGEGDYTPLECQTLWAWLARSLRGQFDRGAVMMTTPGTTGRDLWLRTIGEADGWPVLSTETQRLIRSTSGQGRIETFPKRSALAPALYEYDARLAYLGVTRELPIGEPHQANGDEFATRPHTRSRWLVEFTVPADWRHVGILPLAHEGGAGWSWPNQPGKSFGPTWVDGAELSLAVRHCWPVRVIEGMVWDRVGDPFRTWQDRLLRIMEHGAGLALFDRAPAMVRAAVRAMVLHTFGAMHGAERKTTGIGTSRDVPAGAVNIRQLSDGRMVWTMFEPAAWPETIHPEWTSSIWARARVRLLDAPTADRTVRAGMLHTPAETLVAVRTDAIYTTAAVAWAGEGNDDGKAGRYRHKGTWIGPYPWPRNGVEVLAIKEGTNDAL